MSKLTIIFPSVALALLLAASASAVRDFTFNRSMIRFACNHTLPSAATSSTECVQPLLNLLMVETPLSGYDYAGQVVHRNICHSFGRATCGAELSERQCETCLGFLAESVYPLCGDAVGASLDVTGCHLRYEEYPF